jgi:hypothetical protein
MDGTLMGFWHSRDIPLEETPEALCALGKFALVMTSPLIFLLVVTNIHYHSKNEPEVKAPRKTVYKMITAAELSKEICYSVPINGEN